MTAAEIAKEFGVHRETVYQRLRREGIKKNDHEE
jgi:predicted DNA binding protein